MRASAETASLSAEDARGDAARTAEALLAAGRTVFAEKGFEAASVRAITAEAGATLGAITYHFGSKRGLYDRVVESCLTPLVERVVAAAGAPGSALDRVERVVRAYFGYLLETPELPRLLLHQLLHSGAPPEAAQRSIARMRDALVAVVREGQAQGEIRPGMPVLLAIATISHALHVATLRPALRAMAGVDLSDASMQAQVIDNAVRFVRGGLAARSGDPGDTT